MDRERSKDAECWSCRKKDNQRDRGVIKREQERKGDIRIERCREIGREEDEKAKSYKSRE